MKKNHSTVFIENEKKFWKFKSIHGTILSKLGMTFHLSTKYLQKISKTYLQKSL